MRPVLRRLETAIPLMLVTLASDATAAPRRIDLLVTARDGHAVLVVPTRPEPAYFLETQVGTNLLMDPAGIAVAPSGSIYVGDQILDRIVQIDPDTGEQSILARHDPFPFGNNSGPLEVPDPFALSATSDLFGSDQVYAKASDQLYRATADLLYRWNGIVDAQENAFIEAVAIAVDTRVLAQRPVYMAGSNGVIAYRPGEPCCEFIESPVLIDLGGVPAYHYSTGVALARDGEQSSVYVSQVLVRENDGACLPGAGRARVVRVWPDDTESFEVISEGGLLRCPFFVTAGFDASTLYVVDLGEFYGTGGDPRILQLTRDAGGTWHQSVLSEAIGAVGILPGGMALYVPEPGPGHRIAAALAALAICGRFRHRRC